MSCFDGGNVEPIAVETTAEEVSFRVRIRPDPYTSGTDERFHMQWFYFSAVNVKGRRCRFSIENIHQCSFADGFENYAVVTSYDREDWFRVGCSVVSEKPFTPLQRFNSDAVTAAGSGGAWADKANHIHLRWQLVPEHATVYFAYWTPYSWERHQGLVQSLSVSGAFAHEVIGETLDGRAMDMLVCGEGPLKIWMGARQHPGESMAEWCAEGFLRRLADLDDPKVRQLRAVATIRVVPNMNPDGSVRGHLRTNAGGANLNREWWGGVYADYEAPTLARSPEVFHVMRRLEEEGCDAYIDVHGDECIEANFIAGSEGVPRWDAEMDAVYRHFLAAFLHASPDFQTEKGYEVDRPGEANLSICSNAIAEKFGALAVTLEMPFKDTTYNTPEPTRGWSGPRAQRLGAALVDVMLDTAQVLIAQRGLGDVVA